MHEGTPNLRQKTAFYNNKMSKETPMEDFIVEISNGNEKIYSYVHLSTPVAKPKILLSNIILQTEYCRLKPGWKKKIR